jgi:hypothetical protein
MNQDNLTKTRTERPDKAGFIAFLGIFLLIAGVCFGTWSYWTYGQYRHASDYAEYLRQNPNALVKSKYNQDDIIRSNENSADHDRLEAMWVGAVGLILLSGAALLFVRAVKTYRRIKRNEYEEIDWRALNKPLNRTEVLYGRTHTIAAVIFYIFFGGLVLLTFINSFKASGIDGKGIFIGSFNLLILLTVYYLLTKGKSKSIKSFDASGITRVDGRHFLWSDFRGAIPRIGTSRYGGKYNWRTELMFAAGGVVWVIPQRIKNYEEVYNFIDALPLAVPKEI